MTHSLAVTLCLLSALCVVMSEKKLTVTGDEDGSVSISCTYSEGYEKNAKYFCKEEKKLLGTKCVDLIKTEVHNTQLANERVSLYDDTSARVFTVTIRRLTLEDAGKYYCAVKRSIVRDIYTEVDLQVKEALGSVKSAEKLSVIADEGGPVSISCIYSQGYETNAKYFCKEEKKVLSTNCVNLIKTDAHNTRYTDGRFSLFDNTSARVFTVTIMGVTLEDAGKYFCGVKRIIVRDKYTEVDLHVKQALGSVKSADKLKVTGDQGGTVSISCIYSQGYETNKKYLCKEEKKLFTTKCVDLIKTEEDKTRVTEGRFSLYDDTSARVFTVTITGLTLEDAGKYYCGVNRILVRDEYSEVDLQVKEAAGTEFVFVLDGSGSISHEDFVKAKTFISNVMQKTWRNCSNCRFAVVQYGSDIRTELSLNENDPPATAVNKVKNITQIYKSTRTASAIHYVLEHVFVAENGSKKDAKKIMTVLTDGRILLDPMNLKDVLSSPKIRNITRFAIGVGSEFNNPKTAAELNDIASDAKHVFKAGHYGALDCFVPVLVQRITGIEGASELPSQEKTKFC
ncbi:ITAE protein, partial [Atractosteus spatula]|nr:ITAE protein [Atractosteus spatula]